MPLYKMETNSHFTFLQGVTMNGVNMITINKSMFDTYLQMKKHKSRNWVNKWAPWIHKQNFSKLCSPAKSNWGDKWGYYTQRQNFNSSSPLAKKNCGNKCSCYTQRQNFSKSRPLAKKKKSYKLDNFSFKMLYLVILCRYYIKAK